MSSEASGNPGSERLDEILTLDMAFDIKHGPVRSIMISGVRFLVLPGVFLKALEFLTFALEDFGRDPGGGDFDAGEIIVGDDLGFVGDLETSNGSTVDGASEFKVAFVGVGIGPEEGARDDRVNLKAGG